MAPCDDDGDGLPEADNRRVDPQRLQYKSVIVFDPCQGVEHAGADDVLGQKQRDREAEKNLDRFTRGHHQRAAAVERQQYQRQMDDNRAIEDDCTERISPDQQEPWTHGLGSGDRDKQHRMVEKMHGDEHHQHHSRDEPRCPQVLVGQQSVRWSL